MLAAGTGNPAGTHVGHAGISHAVLRTTNNSQMRGDPHGCGQGLRACMLGSCSGVAHLVDLGRRCPLVNVQQEVPGSAQGQLYRTDLCIIGLGAFSPGHPVLCGA